MKIQAVLVVGAFSLTGGHSCLSVAVEWAPPVAVSCNTLHITWAVRIDCHRSQLMEITTISHKLLCFRCLHMFTIDCECVLFWENESELNTNGQIRSTGLRRTQKWFFFRWATNKYQTLLICCESYTKIWTTTNKRTQCKPLIVKISRIFISNVLASFFFLVIIYIKVQFVTIS